LLNLRNRFALDDSNLQRLRQDAFDGDAEESRERVRDRASHG
jgi:hypothetical protein